VPNDIATKVFNAKYKCDVVVFCSYMVDYRDHPEARSKAIRVKESELKSSDRDLVEKIETFMDEDAEYDILIQNLKQF